MKPEDYAKKVADIAHVYAYRRRHHIAHTGHTVHRLLDAVSALLGQKVTLDDSQRIPPTTQSRPGTDPADAPVQPRP